jgi:hypothetical protein
MQCAKEPQMLAYVDESGCLGMKPTSTPFYVVTAVLFVDRSAADRCHHHIGELREALGITKEFHFNKCSHPNRLRFFQEIVNHPFVYATVVFDKKQMVSKNFAFSKPFLFYPVMALFAGLADRMAQATVVIDRTGSSDFRKSLAKDLRRELNGQFSREVIKKVKDECSHKHNLLQLADMICGAVARSFSNKRKWAGDYREAIQRSKASSGC